MEGFGRFHHCQYGNVVSEEVRLERVWVKGLNDRFETSETG